MENGKLLVIYIYVMRHTFFTTVHLANTGIFLEHLHSYPDLAIRIGCEVGSIHFLSCSTKNVNVILCTWEAVGDQWRDFPICVANVN